MQLYATMNLTDAQLFAFLGGVVREQPPALTPFEREEGVVEPPPPPPLDVRAQAPISDDQWAALQRDGRTTYDCDLVVDVPPTRRGGSCMPLRLVRTRSASLLR